MERAGREYSNILLVGTQILEKAAELGILNNSSISNWRWAWGLVCTRSLEIRSNDLAMAPFVDFLNHSNQPSAFFKYP